MGEGYGAGHIPQEGEPDFIETNCHWVGCSREFETQDELVKASNKGCLIIGELWCKPNNFLSV